MSVQTDAGLFSPFQGSKVGKNLVAFLFHLAVYAADGHLFDERLQSSAVIFHTGTGADERRDETGVTTDWPLVSHRHQQKQTTHFSD